MHSCRVTAAHPPLWTPALTLASWQRLQGQQLLGSRGRERGQGPHPPTRPDCTEGGHRGRILEIKFASADMQILQRTASAAALRPTPPLLADRACVRAAGMRG